MKSQSQRHSPSVAVISCVLLLFGVLGVAAVTLTVRPVVRLSSIGGHFTMTSDTGRKVTDADFKGHPFLVFFGFTHCPDICPTTLTELTRVLKTLGPTTPVKALFVTIDPTRDTPSVLRRYLANFDPHIVGLSGDTQETQKIEHDYRVYAKAGSSAGTVEHTAVVYLMDKDGRFVSTLDLDRSPEKTAAEIKRIL